MDRPETHYARSGDVHIAYQVTGRGPFDVVFAPGHVTHLEAQWRLRSFAPRLEDMSTWCREIRFDKRGTGMSDRVGGVPTLETRMDDLRAVMDAVGSRRAALFGLSEGASMCVLFAATYPDRTAALVLRSAYPRLMWAPDYPWGFTEEQFQTYLDRALRVFGPRAQALAAIHALGAFTDAEAEEFLDFQRIGATPGSLEALIRMNREIDVRDVLPSVRVPTLVLHGTADSTVPLEVAHYVASRIPGSVMREIEGAGHLALGKAAADIQKQVRSFLTDLWSEGGWDQPEPDRMLATVLFLDVAGSTELAHQLGDRNWRDLLERFRAMVRRHLARFRGAEMDTAGDGFLAAFDGPARAIRCATAIVDAAPSLGLHLRAGLHTGECELVDGKLAGIALHIGARVGALAASDEVLVSATVRDLVAGSGIGFDERGAHALKGLPGQWLVYAVETTA